MSEQEAMLHRAALQGLAAMNPSPRIGACVGTLLGTIHHMQQAAEYFPDLRTELEALGLGISAQEAISHRNMSDTVELVSALIRSAESGRLDEWLDKLQAAAANRINPPATTIEV